ncbi:hypothetical protein WJX72_008995 [[Myrmecia] bisecta]|uniref:Uncharacterized protein n=1 Tax=[Myrmecia] bisecta TaxID=41462 RepID=A0AAW1PY29_9CHLO
MAVALPRKAGKPGSNALSQSTEECKKVRQRTKTTGKQPARTGQLSRRPGPQNPFQELGDALLSPLPLDVQQDIRHSLGNIANFFGGITGGVMRAFQPNPQTKVAAAGRR